ncbi:MAG: hypothetical protein EXR72_09490 [Myxococcales bacterium]|nr:hypothetical protein [Myxococcales bacterium]
MEWWNVTLAGLLVAGTALAQTPDLGPPAEDPRQVAARGHFQAGQVYSEQGDLKRALVEFREAARDFDAPALDFNIARTYDRLGDAARAVENYEKYLARVGATDDRAQIETRVTELKRQIGTLTIVIKVNGARVLIDEEPAVPGRSHSVGAGRHRVVASKDGYLTRTVEVDVRAGEVTVTEIDPVAPEQKIVLAPAPSPAPAGPPPRSRWWIGVVVGAVALVAVGAVTTGVLLAPPSEGAPYMGSISPGFQRIDP